MRDEAHEHALLQSLQDEAIRIEVAMLQLKRQQPEMCSERGLNLSMFNTLDLRSVHSYA